MPFRNLTFDYALAHGLLRYFDLGEQLTLIENMRCASRFGITVSEGKAKDIMHNLFDNLHGNSQLIETEMPMFRITLFYMLLRKYRGNSEFREEISRINGNKDHVKFLAQLAGSSQGTLYELRLK